MLGEVEKLLMHRFDAQKSRAEVPDGVAGDVSEGSPRHVFNYDVTDLEKWCLSIGTVKAGLPISRLSKEVGGCL